MPLLNASTPTAAWTGPAGPSTAGRSSRTSSRIELRSGMRIGVDATCWANKRGYGRHARALLNALVRLDRSNCYTFFLDTPTDDDPLPPGVEVCRVLTSAPAAVAASASGRRSLGDLWRMSRAISSA